MPRVTKTKSYSEKSGQVPYFTYKVCMNGSVIVNSTDVTTGQYRLKEEDRVDKAKNRSGHCVTKNCI